MPVPVSSGAPRHTILVADDDEASLLLLADILEADGNTVITTQDGHSALNIIRSQPIDLALLDVMMPGETGFSICREVKADKVTRLIPVVLVTGLANVSDRVLGIDVGADDFISKPVRREEILARVRSLLRIKDYVSELEEAETVLFSLALGIEAKDPYTQGHCHRLSEYSVALGKRVGLTETQLTALRRGGMVHDIGKLGVPESILQKPGPLTSEEHDKMKQHPIIGERICAPLRSFRPVLEIIRHHHEKFDGSGYPDRLKNGAIPLTARILTTVDVYDALVTDRPYRKALPTEQAFGVIQSEVKKGWWDPDLAAEFERLILRGSTQPDGGGANNR